MNKVILILLLASILFCGKKPASVQNAPVSEKYVAAGGGLNVRETPDLNGKKVTTLAKGSKVTILDSKTETFKVGEVSGSWTKVTDGKIQGWAFSGFLSDSAPSGEPDSSACDKAKENAQEEYAACEKQALADNEKCPTCEGVAISSACGAVEMQLDQAVKKACGEKEYFQYRR